MIKRIELKNFMSHSDTVIEPAQGLTVLIGPNNCGKSAVVAALQILSHNDNSTYVLRHESKKCRVGVTTNEGDSIVWRRGKTGGPAYEINGTTYDRLKGAGQPSELVSTLRLPKVECDRDDVDIHFGEQKSPVFLVRDSARTAADFFASSSDAGRMMKMQSLHKQKVRDAKKELKACGSELGVLTEDLQLLASVPALRSEYQEVCSRETELKNLDTARNRLVELIGKIRQQKRIVDSLELKALVLEELSVFPDMGPVDRLGALLHGLREGLVQQARLNAQCDCLEAIPSPPVLESSQLLKGLMGDLKRFSFEYKNRSTAESLLETLTSPPPPRTTVELQDHINGMKKWSKETDRLEQAEIRIDQELKDLEVEIVDWSKRNPRCPTCDHLIEPEHWLRRVRESDSEVDDG